MVEQVLETRVSTLCEGKWQRSYLVREAKRLGEVFSVLNHHFKCIPRLVGRGDYKLQCHVFGHGVRSQPASQRAKTLRHTLTKVKRWATTNLLNFLELMHTEDPTGVSAVRTDFLAETLGDSSVPNREIFLAERLFAVERCHRLLTCRNQEFLIDRVVVFVFARFPHHLRGTRRPRHHGQKVTIETPRSFHILPFVIHKRIQTREKERDGGQTL
jgi:hypothetical protein